MSEWIPVSERLPPEETRVLAYDGDKVFESEYWSGRWEWCADVTHWMPLPESAGGEVMTDILADYREWRAEQEDRIGTHGRRCHMWPRHERCMIHRLARALEDARLTDQERQAIAQISGGTPSAESDCSALDRGTK
jgi:hypothetical protein